MWLPVRTTCFIVVVHAVVATNDQAALAAGGRTWLVEERNGTDDHDASNDRWWYIGWGDHIARDSVQGLPPYNFNRFDVAGFFRTLTAGVGTYVLPANDTRELRPAACGHGIRITTTVEFAADCSSADGVGHSCYARVTEEPPCSFALVLHGRTTTTTTSAGTTASSTATSTATTATTTTTSTATTSSASKRGTALVSLGALVLLRLRAAAAGAS
mmetsp:Transcript_70487/g.199936  ORF Transcript_70487/g.199936 Transcript_70487/m.199936 type:complete len:215 (+) Transcript_70487:68-712(+)